MPIRETKELLKFNIKTRALINSSKILKSVSYVDSNLMRWCLKTGQVCGYRTTYSAPIPLGWFSTANGDCPTLATEGRL